MSQVEIKGWKNGLLNELLLVVPAEGTWEEAQAQIEARLAETKNSSWRGAQMTIDFGMRAVPLPTLGALVERLKAGFGLVTVAVVSTDTITHEAARALVLNAYLMLPGSSASTSARDLTSGNNALYVPHTVRSGQRIVHAGPVIIGGDVNAGAEVVAEGDILIFGTLRGLAHAGSQGDTNARIVAGNMRPQQIRIAGQIARSPEDSAPIPPGLRQPEVARIENGEIQVSLV